MKDNLYESDFYSWINKQVGLLKTKDFENADMENIIEELEDMGNRHSDAIESYFVVILTHLLKWQYQKENRSSSWKGSIVNSRIRINRILKKNPRLKSKLDLLYSDVYYDAVSIASVETGLDKTIFPDENPWSKEETLNNDFWPE